ncbi:MAG: hypothetical protein FWE51_06220 [Coriobacteriia bacterium]|nr:hypothetical protein [Coriobacteriia bacterium]
MKQNSVDTEGTVTLNVFCTYDSNKKSIAWFTADHGSLKLVGYGPHPPSMTMKMEEEEEAVA